MSEMRGQAPGTEGQARLPGVLAEAVRAAAKQAGILQGKRAVRPVRQAAAGEFAVHAVPGMPGLHRLVPQVQQSAV